MYQIYSYIYIINQTQTNAGEHKRTATMKNLLMINKETLKVVRLIKGTEEMISNYFTENGNQNTMNLEISDFDCEEFEREELETLTLFGLKK